MIKKLFKKSPFIKKIYTYFVEKKEKRNNLKQQRRKSVNFVNNLNIQKDTVFLIGSPTHTNIGDSAITIAEKEFLVNAGINKENIIEITLDEFNNHKHYLIKKINRLKSSVFLLGGGNMGNQWLCEELPRREIIKGLKKNKIVILPQTIFYSDDEKGKTERKNSIPIYNGKKNLTIVAREKVSYDIMKELYPKTEILLTPDIVLSTTLNNYNLIEQKRAGILFVKRNDAEKAMKNSDWDIIVNCIKQIGKKYRFTDMYSDKDITKANRMQFVSDKMKEFASSKLVLTDRLHGMIFAAITGTPCIVFSNYNHKVKGTYDWISYLPYIKYVETVEQAIAFIPKMLDLKNCKFDNKPLIPYFDELREIVKSNV